MQQLAAYDVEFLLLSDGPNSPRLARDSSVSPRNECTRSRNRVKSGNEDGTSDDEHDSEPVAMSKETSAAAISRLRGELEEAQRLLTDKAKQLALCQEQLSHAKMALQSLTLENTELKDALAAAL
jgi:hypothetical protein